MIFELTAIEFYKVTECGNTGPTMSGKKDKLFHFHSGTQINLEDLPRTTLYL